jgi:hypothetical protein
VASIGSSRRLKALHESKTGPSGDLAASVQAAAPWMSHEPPAFNWYGRLLVALAASSGPDRGCTGRAKEAHLVSLPRWAFSLLPQAGLKRPPKVKAKGRQ